MQVGHFDVTDDNVLRRDGATVPDAVIDFGDTTASWRVGDIAVTASSVLHHDGASPESALPAIRAFDDQRHLTDAEITALWPLVVLRGAVLVLSGRAQVRLDEANDYASAALDRELRILQRAASVPLAVLTEMTREALGRPLADEPAWTAAPLLPAAVRAVELDASTESPLNDAGAWREAGTLDAAALAELDRGADLVVLPAWRTVLTAAGEPLPTGADRVPTGAVLWLAEPTRCSTGVGAPTRGAGSLTWETGGLAVTLAGALGSGDDGDAVVLPARTPLLVQRHAAGSPPPPRRVSPRLARAWRRVSGDPRRSPRHPRRSGTGGRRRLPHAAPPRAGGGAGALLRRSPAHRARLARAPRRRRRPGCCSTW
ncbi:MAG: hypothetical protein PGN11_08640 [Quadrisphaera sp.]